MSPAASSAAGQPSSLAELEIALPAGHSPAELVAAVRTASGRPDVSHEIIRQSLDARGRGLPLWRYRVAIHPAGAWRRPAADAILPVPASGRGRRAVVVGSGPAGFFAAYTLQRAGFATTILERGKPVAGRVADLAAYEAGGPMAPDSNYCFGAGGAGTCSDGKLTSRTKSIDRERDHVRHLFVEAGAPEDILWQAKPHVGSDLLRPMVDRLLERFRGLGGEVRFGWRAVDLLVGPGRRVHGVACVGADGRASEIPADVTVVACGHSAYDTLLMLLDRGVPFDPKPFAVGVRVEHAQEAVNRAMWGSPSVPGLSGAEYALKARTSAGLQAYTFCMCPGGRVIPAGSFPDCLQVNGVSTRARDGAFANSALVVAVTPEVLAGRPVDARGALETVRSLARNAAVLAGPGGVPADTIGAFRAGRPAEWPAATSCPFAPVPADWPRLLPGPVLGALRGAADLLSRRHPWFGDGQVLGIELTTSAPIQVRAGPGLGVEGFPGLWVLGEGSGRAGGIVSSAAHGIRGALEACGG